jgi:hypothetical protein
VEDTEISLPVYIANASWSAQNLAENGQKHLKCEKLCPLLHVTVKVVKHRDLFSPGSLVITWPSMIAGIVNILLCLLFIFVYFPLRTIVHYNLLILP